MLRSTFLPQRSLRNFQLSRSITSYLTIESEYKLGIKQLDYLPTAKKFLGLVDLQLLRKPMTMIPRVLWKPERDNWEICSFSKSASNKLIFPSVHRRFIIISFK